MKNLFVIGCVAMLSCATFASAQASPAKATSIVKASDVTDFSARKKMKRMKKGMMKPRTNDASKMGGEPPSGSMPGQKKGM